MPEINCCYEVFGLRVASEIALPELAVARPGGQPEVEIRLGSVPIRDGHQSGLSIFSDGALLRIPEVADYWMAGGREVVVEPNHSASDRNVRLFLLGSAIAAILHQRALLPLHANAIVIEGKAIAFLGHPGAGKSTMAAWFHDQGLGVLADDVCAVTFDAEGRAIAHPGIPRLRLWREALEASGRTTADYEMSFDDIDKYNVPTRLNSVSGGVVLDHLYLLEKADEAKPPAIARLSGAAAVEVLVANTYRGAYVSMMGKTREHLLACARLARLAPVFRASRAWGLDLLDEEGRRLEEHARAIIAGNGAD